MSFIYRDSSLVPRMHYNQNSASYQTFKAYWRTTSINGIEVYVGQMIFYANGWIVDEKLKKFVKSLGITWEDFISQDIDSDIETMYFYLKGGYVWSGEKAWTDFGENVTPTTSYDAPTASEIAIHINSQYEVGEELKATVSYGGSLARYINSHELTWEATGSSIKISPFDSSAIRTAIHSNPWYYLVNSRHMPYSKDSNPFQLYEGGNTSPGTYYAPTDRKITPCEVSSKKKYGILGLLGYNQNFELEINDNGEAVLYDERKTTSHTADGESLRYRYSLSYIFKGVKETDKIVTDILDWFNYYYEDLDNIKYEPIEPDRYKEALTTTMIDTKYKHVFLEMMTDPQTRNLTNGEDVQDSLYYKQAKQINEIDNNGNEVTGYKYQNYLSVDGTSQMKKSDFVKMLSKSIDIDYTVEEASFWEKLISIVIIVIAVAIAWYATGFVAGTLAKLAMFAGTLSTSLSVGGMLLSHFGGLSAGGLVKIIGKFAQISGYVALVAGLLSAYQSYAANVAQSKNIANGATNVLTGDALKAAVKEVSIMDIVEYAFDSVIDSVVSVFTEPSTVSTKELVSYVGDGIDMIKKVTDYMTDKDMQELQEAYNEASAHQKEYEESLSSNVFKDASIYIDMELAETAEYDAISRIDLMKFQDSNATFKTNESYNWHIGVNS